MYAGSDDLQSASSGGGAGHPGGPSAGVLSAMLEHADSQIAYLDLDFRVAWANERYARCSGFSRAELLGRRHVDLFPAHEAEPVLLRVRETGEAARRQAEPLLDPHDPAGEPTYWTWSVVPVTDEGGSVRGFVFSRTDVTDQTRVLLERDRAASESEERFRLFMRHSPAAAWVVTVEGRFRYVSPGYLRMIGTNREDVIGHTISDVFPRELAERYLRDNEVALSEWRLLQTIAPGLRGDGSPGQFLVVKFPYRTPSGEALLGGMALDITQLTHAREELDRAQAVAHTGSWRLNVPQNQLLWSDETHRIFGLPKETPLTYETFLASVHPDDRDYVERSWAAALLGETYDIEHRIVVGDEVKWVRERAELDFSKTGELIGGFGIVQDITASKHAEDALLRAKDAAEAGNRAKTEFLGRMSHEMRTPLNGLLGMIELALMGELPDKTREYLELSKRAAQRLTEWLSDILELAQLEAEKVELREANFDPRWVVDGAVSAQRRIAEKKGLHLSVQIADAVPAVVRGDHARLQQILTSLVVNAVRFTDRGGVHVTVSAEDKGTRSGLLFQVRDTGRGIRPEDLGSLFEPDSAAIAATHAEYGGGGLSLSIAGRLARLMGARIWAESVPGAGSTFSLAVQLPPR